LSRDPFASTWIHHRVLGSTNDEALRLLVEGRTPLPLVVRADRQTAGRGRGPNVWWSDAGSLSFTLGLDPAPLGLTTAQEPTVALAVAVAVIDAIEEGQRPGALGIRWPNDVEAGGKKVGGILPERVETAGGARLAIGVGLNVATRLDDAPEPVRAMATSLSEIGATVPIDDLLARLIGRIGPALAGLAARDAALADRWNALDTLRGEPVRIDQGGRILAGIARGIDAEGALRVESQGAIVTVRGGRVLRPSRG
jgi:BirA family biotin operon repressor/biotin-[acetyl-CoA-carboxylase] ligase